ncbi:MAG TPA: bifunctional metallophosphatase/5'-nucleotidase [Gemmatimonadales bacterium]|nr:bifunctional metallophosphatase/5'-nucleotidase [Gemmatimonadales bacterium]
MRIRLILLLFLAACGRAPAPQATPLPAADQVVRLTVLHINDVYEITPVEGGRSGGLARVATVRQQLLRQSPNLLFTLGGDFFSPSALGTAVVDGERLGGKQMVAVLNAAGLDLAVYGNHEFDIRADEFAQRLDESRFQYLGTNVTDSLGRDFPKSSRHRIYTFRNPTGLALRVGVVGSVIPSNPVPYVRYLDWYESVRSQVALIRDSVDVLIGLTHLGLEQDVRFAEELGEFDLIVGGHEHENWILRRGSALTPIVKADANVRTIAVIHVTWHAGTRRTVVEPRIVAIGDTIPDDPAVAAEVGRWTEAGFAGFRAQGFEPERVVTTTDEALDGLEANNRNRPTNLSSLIAAAYFAEAGDVDLGIVNTGSIRIDDVLSAGPITEYDLIRVLPFGGNLFTVRMTGALLRRVLDQGEANRGSGGYLAHHRVGRAADGAWLVGEAPLDDARIYRVALPDFLVSGRERGLDYLNLAHPDLTMGRELRDVRLALKDEMVRRWGR